MKRIHLLHIGDTHAQASGARSADQWRALDAAIAYGEQLGDVAAWIWPGDLFHTTSDAADRNALQIRVQRMANLAPVLIVRGNHDLPGELDCFARLAAAWEIKVSLVPEVVRLQTPIERVVPPGFDDAPGWLDLFAFTMPYPNAGSLVAAGTPPDQISQVARVALDAVMMAAADHFASADPLDIPLFTGHFNVTGAVSSVGQPQIGVEVELDETMLARLPAHVHVATNHIHKHQKVGRAVYAGSICRMNFGELEPKGLIDITYDVTDRAVEYSGWTFVPMDVPPMYHVEGQLSSKGFEYDVLGLDAVARQTWATLGPAFFKGADVRVRYTYKKAEAGVLNVAHIHAEFAEARSLKIEAIPQQDHELRAPEVVAATTVADKLEHYAARQGLTWTPALAAKAAALESQDVDAWRAAAVAHVTAIGADVLLEGK